MAEFTLPSGRVVETHEPTFGEEIHVVSVGAGSIEDLVYAKFAVIVPGLNRDEISGLGRKDGRALLAEVGRIWDERPEEDLPKGNGSRPSSMVSSRVRSTKKQPNA